jgi:hypothetical protein
MEKMKNKGLTMIELIVSLGLSSIVVGLIFSFFICNYKGYKSIRNNSELSFQAQYILNYMADKIINSNSVSLIRGDAAIYSMTLVRNAETEYLLKKVSFKFGNEFDKNYVFHIVDNDIRYGTGVADMKPTVELGNYVDSMYISLFKDDSFQNANAVKLKIVMKKDGQMYEAFQAVYMRNSGFK